ncbi:hypothetical protein ACX9NE_22605 [Mycobacterium sp. ML4]
MVVATVAEGRPVSRTAWCNDAAETEITFFTRYESERAASWRRHPMLRQRFRGIELRGRSKCAGQ